MGDKAVYRINDGENGQTNLGFHDNNAENGQRKDVNLNMESETRNSIKDLAGNNNDVIILCKHPVRKDVLLIVVKSGLLLLYMAYFVYCMTVEFGSEGSIRLVVGTGLLVLLIVVKFLKRLDIYSACKKLLRSRPLRSGSRPRTVLRWLLYVVVFGLIVTYTTISVRRTGLANLWSLLGLGVFTLGLFLTSTNKRQISWHTVFWTYALQFLLAFLVLKTTAGAYAIDWLSKRLIEFLAQADEGSKVLFGPKYKDFNIIFETFPRIIFFFAAISVLTHFGVIQAINYHLGNLLGFITGVSPGEAMNATINMFLGQLILGYLFWPLSFIMGVPTEDCLIVSQQLGLRTISFPGTAFVELSVIVKNRLEYENYGRHFNDSFNMNSDIILPQWNTTLKGGIIQERSETICTFALAGLASFLMVAVGIGVFQVMIPEKFHMMPKLVLRALVVSTVACYITGCIAGLLYEGK